MMSMMSSPLKRPLRPRNSFSPSSWSSGLNSKWNESLPYGQMESRADLSVMYSVLPMVQPVKARDASLMSFSGVVSDPQGEQLEQLPAVVLVDRTVMVLAVIEPHDHRRVLRQLQQQRAETAHTVPGEHPDLVVQHLAVSQLAVAGGEDAVPEQRRLLAQRRVRGDHPVHPAWRRPRSPSCPYDRGGTAVSDRVDMWFGLSESSRRSRPLPRTLVPRALSARPSMRQNRPAASGVPSVESAV